MKNNQVLVIALSVLMLAFFSNLVITGKIVQECTDSDAKDFFNQGTTLTESGSIEDGCSGFNVIEYYCESNKLRFQTYKCENGCSEGRCLEKEIKNYDEIFEGNIKEYVKVESGGDKLEINEFLGDVVDVFTQEDLISLESGDVYTREGRTKYNQYLRLNDGNLKSGSLNFSENEDDEAEMYLIFTDDYDMFEYAIEFEQGFESEIKDGELVDLVGQKLNMLGRTYEVVDASLDTATDVFELSLISGSVEGTMNEGDKRTYTIDGKKYTVEIELVDDSNREVLVSLNGERSNPLREGSLYYFKKSDIMFSVVDVLVNEASEGDEIVGFYLDAQRVKMTDKFSDDSFRNTIEVNGNAISEGSVKVKGVKDGDQFRVSSIRYRLKPDAKKGGDVYVEQEKGVRDYIEDREGMFGDWDIVFKGLEVKSKTYLKLESSGNGYDMEFENNKGQSYNFDFVSNSNGNLVLGNNDQRLYFIESSNSTNYIVEKDDFLVLTDDNDRGGITNILRYESIDTSSKLITFNDLSTGRIEAVYIGTEGSDATGTLLVSGSSYKISIGPAPDYNLAVDLNNDNTFSGAESNIILRGGGILDLGSSNTPNSDFVLTLTTQRKQFDEASSDEVLEIDIDNNGNGVDLNVDSQSGLTVITEDGEKKAMSKYGVYFEQDVKDGSDELTVEYPTEQIFGNVYLVFYETPDNYVNVIEDKKVETKTEKKEDIVEEKKTVEIKEVKEEEPKQTDDSKEVIETNEKQFSILNFLRKIFFIFGMLI